MTEQQASSDGRTGFHPYHLVVGLLSGTALGVASAAVVWVFAFVTPILLGMIVFFLSERARYVAVGMFAAGMGLIVFEVTSFALLLI
ncbi:hypothetical protein I3U40_00310 [Mycobacteroides abscessus subsp. abscessus]|uniref:hypothetical protein n=1 Tax=Mycobacteroides abscessus TaxID=36809 RepID=UPI0009A6FBCF|nr:hypothetical protein [Mycobacteroides abscessus]QSM94343.1 hypothetical protein I3U31_00310 [Mycobacteroides abscessus subsp. abscessus]QSM99377.1 hypothetical protein I3U40_00310 [Mycobacteroides abscessus subsp. abscessus]SLJ15037.1 Uncharacterised protein [Mycobacteroides abscessus subsp. abscessus]